VIFDVLARRRRSTMHLPYAERRRILEALGLHGPAWCTAETFDDGPALFAAVERQGLEGIVAKRLNSPYRSGMRDWVKVKNRSYWRYGQELELAQSRRRVRTII
jgi:bifunctional non-homologous end joining protein LigD